MPSQPLLLDRDLDSSDSNAFFKEAQKNGTLADIIFNCSDGGKIRAHQESTLLTRWYREYVRERVLKRKLTHDF